MCAPLLVTCGREVAQPLQFTTEVALFGEMPDDSRIAPFTPFCKCMILVLSMRVLLFHVQDPPRFGTDSVALLKTVLLQLHCSLGNPSVGFA